MYLETNFVDYMVPRLIVRKNETKVDSHIDANAKPQYCNALLHKRNLFSHLQLNSITCLMNCSSSLKPRYFIPLPCACLDVNILPWYHVAKVMLAWNESNLNLNTWNMNHLSNYWCTHVWYKPWISLKLFSFWTNTLYSTP